MEIVNKNINNLKPYEKNPRINDEAVKYVMESIKQFGFKVPIVIDSNDVIVCGHTRYKAAKKLKLDKVPCVIADDLTEEQIKAYRLADNKVAEKAEWDFNLLNEELEDLINFDMELLGFDDDVLEDNAEKVEEDDFDVETEIEDIEEPTSKLGDIYQLGNHRLMCGDSTSIIDVEKLMGDIKADLLFTDPPYNVNISNSKGMTIENDNMNDDLFKQFLSDAFKCASLSLKEGGAFYIWHADSESLNFRLACKENDLSVRQGLIWVKNAASFGRQDYKWKHEPCLYGWKNGAAHYFVKEFNHSTVIEDEIDLDKLKKEDMKALLKEILSDKIKTTVIHEDRPLINDLHPTMKPLKLCGDLIKNSSRQGDNVLDLFGGSGSTMMTCEQLGRNCYIMEYDPKYVDVIIKRWEQFTGEKAVLLDT